MVSKSNHIKFVRFVLFGVSEEAKKGKGKGNPVRVISRSRRLRLITPTSTSIILDITKTSCNNCLLLLIHFCG